MAHKAHLGKELVLQSAQQAAVSQRLLQRWVGVFLELLMFLFTRLFATTHKLISVQLD